MYTLIVLAFTLTVLWFVYKYVNKEMCESETDEKKCCCKTEKDESDEEETKLKLGEKDDG